jgi:hypothetical protein
VLRVEDKHLYYLLLIVRLSLRLFTCRWPVKAGGFVFERLLHLHNHHHHLTSVGLARCPSPSSLSRSKIIIPLRQATVVTSPRPAVGVAPFIHQHHPRLRILSPKNTTAVLPLRTRPPAQPPRRDRSSRSQTPQSASLARPIFF